MMKNIENMEYEQLWDLDGQNLTEEEFKDLLRHKAVAKSYIDGSTWDDDADVERSVYRMRLSKGSTITVYVDDQQ